MIQVPLDKIIPIEEALLDIGKIMDSVKAQKSLFVVTKDGKPHSAIIDIDLLEHLPELNHDGETKNINDIGQQNTVEEIQQNMQQEPLTPISQGATTPQPQNPVQPQAQTMTPSEEFTPQQTVQKDNIQQKAQEELKDVLSEDIGPWSDTPSPDGKGPQDLDI